MTDPRREVDRASVTIRLSGNPLASEIGAILNAAWLEAWEQEMEWAEEGKPHLRMFLKTTQLGLAILDLARAINEEAK